jgi:hypothetical protein
VNQQDELPGPAVTVARSEMILAIGNVGRTLVPVSFIAWLHRFAFNQVSIVDLCFGRAALS